MAADTQLASSVTAVQTSSSTYADLTTMTLTTAAVDTRDYEVNFDGEFSSDRGEQDVSVRLVVDGVAVAASERVLHFSTLPYPGTTGEKKNGRTFHFAVAVAAAKVVKVQWKVSGGTAHAYNRALSISSTSLDTGVLPADSVSFAEFQEIDSLRLVGRTTALTGDCEQISTGSSLALGTGTLSRAALSGDIIAAADSNVTTFAGKSLKTADQAITSAAATPVAITSLDVVVVAGHAYQVSYNFSAEDTGNGADMWDFTITGPAGAALDATNSYSENTGGTFPAGSQFPAKRLSQFNVLYKPTGSGTIVLKVRETADAGGNELTVYEGSNVSATDVGVF